MAEGQSSSESTTAVPFGVFLLLGKNEGEGIAVLLEEGEAEDYSLIFCIELWIGV